MSTFPPEYDYLDVVEPFTWYRTVDDAAALIQSLSTESLSALTRAYDQIARQGHAQDLVNLAEADPRSAASRAILHLFAIFEMLADRGVEPFAGRTVEYVVEPVGCDWGKLPAELRFLSDGLIRFGAARSHDQMRRFVDGLSEADQSALRQLSNGIRDRDLVADVFEWIEENPMSEHRESLALVNLIQVMEMAGCPIEEQP